MSNVFIAEGEGHEFKVIYDKEALINEINQERVDKAEDFEDEYYIPIGGSDDDAKITFEEYNKNIDVMVAAIELHTQEKFLLNAITEAAKKKNGTFKKGQVISVQRCDNSYYSDEEYGWPCDELRFKATDDLTLELMISRVVIEY